MTVWADHADDISKAYSGTGALKTDFTRTGKRSRRGLLDDGLNSVMRYLKNNFFDGPRQVGSSSSIIAFPSNLPGGTKPLLTPLPPFPSNFVTLGRLRPHHRQLDAPSRAQRSREFVVG